MMLGNRFPYRSGRAVRVPGMKSNKKLERTFLEGIVGVKGAVGKREALT